MNLAEKETEYLFSYGTLQEEGVQLATFGRRLAGTPDTLVGYEITLIPIKDQEIVASSADTHYRNIQYTGIASDLVAGTVFSVTNKELEHADVYEATAEYERVLVQLQSGTNAWVYLSNSQ